MFRWKEFRYRLEELGCRLLRRGLPRLSRRSCVRLANGLGALAYLLDARGRGVALANLKCVFGERYSPGERRALARASYRNFLRTMLDLFWAQNLTPANHAEWLRLEGFEALRERHAQSPGGAILFCVHQGNWEWASLAFGFAGLPTTIVAENFKNPRLTRIFQSLREVSGHTLIAQENSLLRMLKIVKRRGTTGMLIEAYITSASKVAVVTSIVIEEGVEAAAG